MAGALEHDVVAEIALKFAMHHIPSVERRKYSQYGALVEPTDLRERCLDPFDACES